MVVKLQCEQFMGLKAQNAQYVSYPSDKTVWQNLLFNISIKSLGALRHAECLKIALALFQFILYIGQIFEEQNYSDSIS